MTKFSLKPAYPARYALAIAAGILLALAFPRVSIAGFAWVAPGLLLFAAIGVRPGLAFRIGYIGGFAYYLTTLNWLLYIPVKFLPILGWIALSAYLSLFPAVWVWICWKLFPGSISIARHPWDRTSHRAIFETSWTQRAVWTIKCAALWVALEMILGRFLSGFPWDFLGVSQYKMLPIIQIAAFTGVYGVSFLIIWFSASLLLTGLALTRIPLSLAVVTRNWVHEIIFPLLAIFMVATYGISTIRGYRAPSETTRVALIQPSIPQTLIWDESENENRFRQLIALSEQALTNNVDILLWPEASVPNMLRHHDATAEAVIALAKKHKAWAILGSDDAEMRPGGRTLRDVDYYNSAFLISPDGELTGIYKKRQLVIFGEYTPFVKQLPFLRTISPAGEGGFTPGTKPIPFNLEALGVLASVLICFEDTFPHLVREYVEPNTDILMNLTNNGWFGESAAQWQHAATAVLRAVENRIPLVRCANNGLTCWVDSIGRMHEVYFPDSKDIYKVGYKIAEVPVLGPGESRALTFYTRHGDVFGWTCVALVVLNLLAIYIRTGLRRKTSAATPSPEPQAN